MTEAEWFECAEPYSMMDVLEGKTGVRKARLFGVACCRRIWHLLLDHRGRHAVEVAEQFADGLARRRDLARAHAVAAEDSKHPDEDKWEVDAACVNWATEAAALAATKDCWEAFDAAQYAAYVVGEFDTSIPREAAKAREKASQSQLLRCIFGNPFDPVTLDPSWQTSTVSKLAQATYEERILPGGELDLTRLAVLADALEDAGCTAAAILTHLRGSNPHVRGCHVLDALLDKS